jgi:plasmid rolling circle replication initiator protein Rep
MKTATGLTILHRKVKKAIRVEAYNENDLNNLNQHNWWKRVKKNFKL